MLLVASEDIRKIWGGRDTVKGGICNNLKSSAKLSNIEFDCQSILRKDNFCLNILWMQMSKKKIENCFE